MGWAKQKIYILRIRRIYIISYVHLHGHVLFLYTSALNSTEQVDIQLRKKTAWYPPLFAPNRRTSDGFPSGVSRHGGEQTPRDAHTDLGLLGPQSRFGNTPLKFLTLLEPQSRFGDKPLKFQVVCPQNGTAILKGLSSLSRKTGLQSLKERVHNAMTISMPYFCSATKHRCVCAPCLFFAAISPFGTIVNRTKYCL